MADRETLAAYAANTEAYRQVVSDAGGNSMLDGFLERLPPRHAFSTSDAVSETVPPPCRRRGIS